MSELIYAYTCLGPTPPYVNISKAGDSLNITVRGPETVERTSGDEPTTTINHYKPGAQATVPIPLDQIPVMIEILSHYSTTVHRETVLVVNEVHAELVSAIEAWPPMHSAHEGYGVIMEEMRELEEHIFTNQKRRDLPAMRKEAIQLAAMAMRFVLDVCDEKRGRV